MDKVGLGWDTQTVEGENRHISVPWWLPTVLLWHRCVCSRGLSWMESAKMTQRPSCEKSVSRPDCLVASS